MGQHLVTAIWLLLNPGPNQLKDEADLIKVDRHLVTGIWLLLNPGRNQLKDEEHLIKGRH